MKIQPGSLVRNRVALLKWKAHDLVHAAIKQGKLMRRSCEICGHVKTEAHHDDYNKPLDVRWLCRIHHKRAHNPQAKSRLPRKQFDLEAHANRVQMMLFDRYFKKGNGL